jgi:hypothetical protein
MSKAAKLQDPRSTLFENECQCSLFSLSDLKSRHLELDILSSRSYSPRARVGIRLRLGFVRYAVITMGWLRYTGQTVVGETREQEVRPKGS